ncbi:digestive cysteine proteinase 1 [Microplitis mediator]|uniref:digestive cysteine proteinase 1 n=1 Tax=Microplitis mediator TaxID=375433 RepID=UPI0025522B7A|nr:digestive cysteine proteinase 1 [Microplitis mediator]XP_057341417.1 digestive cysteine proteinase 1 [Microplitis mediator]
MYHLSRICFILLIGISCTSALVRKPIFSKKHSKSQVGKKSATAVEFNDQYVTRGTLYIPYAEIKEPFYAWYDGKLGSSRIDYYGGMVKTFQLSGDGSHGSSIKIAPMTTEEEMNKESCFKIYGDEQMAIRPQTILPDTHGMQCIGEEMINGIECEKWRLVEKFGEKTNKYTLWIRYKKSSESGIKQAIPVRYEMKGFNSLLGSHYDHYYLNYDWYSYETPDANVFEVANNMSCTGFPGPGDRHLFTFNPMREFISNDHRHVDTEFNIFKRKYNKQYKDLKEHGNRTEVFRQNLRYIHSMNRKSQGYQLEVNHLADRTDDELKYLRGKQYTPNTYNGGLPFPHDVEKESAKIPESHDWRLFGAVTPVKDQSVCGSCWSFGTTGAVEGAYFMKYKTLVRLSQQALIDCSWGYGNNGCDGGEDFRSYEWIMKHGGLPTEDEYGGYIGQDGYCHINNVTLTAKMAGFVNVTTGSPDALKLALFKHGPISIAIDASQKTFSFYSNGVYYDPNCKNTPDGLDHAVLAVGYGTMNGQGYWLVKNSWSNYWGNDGYILMAQKNNNCGVMTAPTYAIAA